MPDDNFNKPVHYAAACRTSSEPMKLLLEKGVAVNEPNAEGISKK